MTKATWRLTVSPAWRGAFADALHTLATLEHPAELIQDTERSRVVLVHAGATAIVAKRSKTQERRPWIRLASLYRGGDGARAYRNLTRLQASGLPVPEPVFVLERVRWGMVMVSWHGYVRLDGRPCRCADAEPVARVLRQFHDEGWVHRDPHVANFLMHDGRVAVIDCARARPWRSRYAQQYDIVLLNKCCPGADARYPGFLPSDPLYRLARVHNAWVVGWRRAKRTAKGR